MSDWADEKAIEVSRHCRATFGYRDGDISSEERYIAAALREARETERAACEALARTYAEGMDIRDGSKFAEGVYAACKDIADAIAARKSKET